MIGHRCATSYISIHLACNEEDQLASTTLPSLAAGGKKDGDLGPPLGEATLAVGGSENVLSGGLGGRALPKTLSLT